jgi:hypothetical protein
MVTVRCCRVSSHFSPAPNVLSPSRPSTEPLPTSRRRAWKVFDLITAFRPLSCACVVCLSRTITLNRHFATFHVAPVLCHTRSLHPQSTFAAFEMATLAPIQSALYHFAVNSPKNSVFLRNDGRPPTQPETSTLPRTRPVQVHSTVFQGVSTTHACWPCH